MNNIIRYQNAALQYYLDLTGSSYLHYGYWEPIPPANAELTVTQLRLAQAAYANHLLSFIPKDIHTALDVGCGNGDNAIAMLERGLQVTGLAPDPSQQANFLERTNGKAKFHMQTFDEFVHNSHQQERSPKNDFVLCSESSLYMSPV